MSARPALLALLLVLAACEAGPMGTGPSGGGKADDPLSCGAGRTCLSFRRFDVVFTNPLCELYEYESPVLTADGTEAILAKPKNVYCIRERDALASATRAESPQSRLVNWIEATGPGDAIFLASLSFSDPVIFEALCLTEALVTVVLDKPTSLSDRLGGECGPDKEVLIRGNEGSIGFAHVKLLLVNPDAPGPADEDDDFVRMAFGSANFSAGTHIHHENWQFLEVARQSHFVENHLCLLRALVEEGATAGKGAFRAALAGCRAHIEHPEEDDIKAFFVPALEDRRAAAAALLGGIDAAASVDVAVHRFGHTDMVRGLAERLQADVDFRVRMVADDDLYWLRPLAGEGAKIGLNDAFEADNVDRLEAADGEGDGEIDRFSTGQFRIKYLETRHAEFLLHHNKFILYRGLPDRPDAVLCGAANFTRAGFEHNLENIYYVEIPHVVQAFSDQFARFWDGARASEEEPDPPRATAPEKMPAIDLQID